MRLNDDTGDNSLALSLLVLVLAAIGILAMTALVALGADAAEPCLTREQARAKYPTSYLYWRTAQRCWYARPAVGRANPTQPRATRSVRPHDVKVVRWREFNELDAAADRDTFFDGEPVPVWRLAPIPHPRFLPWDQRIGM